MTQKRTRSQLKILHWFTHHPWLKLISLLLAIIVWLYVKEELLRAIR